LTTFADNRANKDIYGKLDSNLTCINVYNFVKCVNFDDGKKCLEVKEFAEECIKKSFYTVWSYLYNKDLYPAFNRTDWCRSGWTDEIAANESYDAVSCCSQWPKTSYSFATKDKCDKMCKKKSTPTECFHVCYQKVLKHITNGTFNKQEIKKQFMESITNVELAKKYDAIVDESIRKCGAICKFFKDGIKQHNAIEFHR